MLFDTGTNYDIAYEEHTNHGWCGLDGGLKDEIGPFVIYLCFVVLGTTWFLDYTLFITEGFYQPKIRYSHSESGSMFFLVLEI